MVSFRDRLLTPAGARAVTHPLAIVAAGGVAGALLAVGAPVVAAAAAGAAGWAGVVASRVPRDPDAGAVDHRGLTDPWRRYVVEAMAARSRFGTAVREVQAGPLRDRLASVAARVEDGVREVERIARHGHRLDLAIRQLDEPDDLRRRVATAQSADAPAEVVTSLQAQLASTERIRAVADDTRRRLQVLDAQLDEAVARAVELGLRQGDDRELGELGADVDTVVGDMEQLRVALEDTDAL